MFAKPTVGSVVTVTTEYPNYVVWRDRDLHTYTDVRVVKSESWDEPNTFRVATGMQRFPIAVVPLKRVIELKVNGKVGLTVAEKQAATRTEIVKGSKGDEYVVTIEGNVGNCTCVGYQFRRRCKHIDKVLSGK